MTQKPTKKQINLINELQLLGASISCDDHGNPSNSMFETIENTDTYIKKWIYLKRKNRTFMSQSDYGGVYN